jgi:putative NADH-flavin reductase
MNLLVFGATGGTGREVVEQSLSAGHHVTAVVRNPSKISLRHSRLNIVPGDVLEPDTFGPAMAGQEAVVSAIGATDRSPTNIFSVGLLNILMAMRQANVSRLICVSASGLDPGPLLQKLMVKPLLWAFFKEAYTDMRRMEIIVRASPVAWTIIRPPRLTDGPRTGKYDVAIQKPLRHGWQISRADLADYIVRCLNEPALHRAMVELAY